MEKLVVFVGSVFVLWYKIVGLFFLYSIVLVEGLGENMVIGKL